MKKSKRRIALVSSIFLGLGLVLAASVSSPAAGLVPGEYTVEAALDENCVHKMGRIVVPAGFVAANFRLYFIDSTWLPCSGPTPPDFEEFCISREPEGELVYWYRLNRKDRTTAETEKFADVVLGPGTYGVHVGGGKRTIVKVDFRLQTDSPSMTVQLWGTQRRGTSPTSGNVADGNEIYLSSPATVVGVSGLGNSTNPMDKWAADFCIWSAFLTGDRWDYRTAGAKNKREICRKCVLAGSVNINIINQVLPPGRYKVFTGTLQGQQLENRVEITLRKTPFAVPNVYVPCLVLYSSGYKPAGPPFEARLKTTVLAEGKTLWQFSEENGQLLNQLPALGPDGTLYVTSGARLYAIIPDGSKKWIFNIPTPGAGSPVVDQDGTIYFVSGVFVYAVKPDGTKKWEWKAQPEAGLGAIALRPDGAIIVGHAASGSYVRKVMALSRKGSLLWSTDSKITTVYSLTTGLKGEVYYSIGGSISNIGLEALDAGSGKSLWIADLGWNAYTYGGLAVDEKGTIYAPLTNAGRLVALTPAGKKIWEYAPPSRSSIGPVSIGPDGTLYAVFLGQGLHAFSPDGRLKWRAGGAPTIGGVAVDSQGTAYYLGFASGQWVLTAINADGSIRWTAGIPCGPGSPAIDSKGIIYVVGGDKVTAVQGSAPLASSPWPRDRADNGNTGSAKRK